MDVIDKDNGKIVDSVLWVLISGAEWKDLPIEYGKWKSVHKRYIVGPRLAARPRNISLKRNTSYLV